MKRSVRSAVGWGLRYAAAFSLLATLIGAAQSVRAGNSFAETLSLLGLIVLAYFGGALVAGVVVGTLLPVGRTRIGAMVLGFVGGLPAYGAVGMAVVPLGSWWPDLVYVTMLCAVTVGPPVGYLIWRDESRSS